MPVPNIIPTYLTLGIFHVLVGAISSIKMSIGPIPFIEAIPSGMILKPQYTFKAVIR